MRSLAAILFVAQLAATAAAQRQPAASPPRSPQSAAPIDLTGYWVSLVTEDWRWRMVTPAKGDYASVPINPEGRRVADAWDLGKDDAAGNQCKAFGVGGIMRIPGRAHVTWPEEDTLKVEFDAGSQTRLLHFGGEARADGERSWQGYSSASWVFAGAAGGPTQFTANSLVPGQAPRPASGALKVVTTRMREGYLRKNGVPYSENAVITEYYDRFGPEPNGDVFLVVRTTLEDPKYLTQPFVTSTHFKLERDGSRWHPTPCKVEPPL